MARSIVKVPFAMMCASAIRHYVDWRGQPEQESAGGGTKVVNNQFPRWMTEIELALTKETAGYWRSLILQMEGRRNIARLFMLDTQIFDPFALMPAAELDLENAFGIGTYSGPAMSFDDPPQITAAASAAAGATSISVTVEDVALIPRIGQIISADDWPMFVTDVTANGGTSYTLGVKMQRATIASGDPINLVATGQFELMSDTAGQPGYDLTLVSSPALTFREVINR